MYFTVYKIINNLNNKVYIGVHQTNNLNDCYMGSGELIKRAIKKYGVVNFTKEYIRIFDNSEEMFALEKKLVNEAFVKSNMTYNMSLGGLGGIGCNLVNYEKLKEYLDDKHSKLKLDYLENPKQCIGCVNFLDYESRFNSFCSQSCSATCNNQKREKKEVPPKQPKPKDIYSANQKRCGECDAILEYEKRRNSFCGRSCKASYTNRNRNKV